MCLFSYFAIRSCGDVFRPLVFGDVRCVSNLHSDDKESLFPIKIQIKYKGVPIKKWHCSQYELGKSYRFSRVNG